MTMQGVRWVALGFSVLASFGCNGAADELGELDMAGEVAVVEEGKADTALSVSVQSGRSTRFTFTTGTTPVAITVDCAPPSNPDTVGVVFAVTAPDLGIATSSSQPARAGFWRWVGRLASGSHAVTLTGRSGSASCRATVQTLSSTASCTSRVEHRSPNVNHEHVRVGADASADWEVFPTSGNHWGTWAPWNRVYTRPVKRGYLLHNLEHGGLVLSYNCSSPSQSSACRTAHDNLVALKQSLGLYRVIVTPDPTQSARYGVRGWRWGYLSDCFDAQSASRFALGRYRRGREDTDANPPYPFDPSTTNVPCQNLMAAPDGC
jgi:hypothetical protein